MANTLSDQERNLLDADYVTILENDLSIIP